MRMVALRAVPAFQKLNRTMRSQIIPFILASLVFVACSDDKTAEPVRLCADADQLDGQCVGATTETLCADAPCQQDTDCESLTTVDDQPSLTAALTSATPGSCVALRPGKYDSAEVKPGVKLLGAGLKGTSVSHIITINVAGQPANTPAALIRGVSATQVRADAPTELEHSRVSGGDHVDPADDTSAIVAIAVPQGSSIKLTNSTVEASLGYGILATDPTSVDLSRSLVRNNKDAGLWVQCTLGCNCASAVNASVSDSVLHSNARFNALFLGTQASAKHVNLATGQTPEGTFAGDGSGSGIVVGSCSSFTAERFHVLNNTNVGMLIDNSSATLGTGAERGIIIQGNEGYGVWIQNLDDTLGQTATLKGVAIDSNNGVGLGLAGQSRGIIIQGTQISNTKTVALASNQSTVVSGDGLCWRDGAQATLENLTLSNNERANILIDSPPGDGSTVAGIIIQGSPGTEGSIIIQGLNGTTGMPSGMASYNPTLLPANTLDVAPRLKAPIAQLGAVTRSSLHGHGALVHPHSAREPKALRFGRGDLNRHWLIQRELFGDVQVLEHHLGGAGAVSGAHERHRSVAPFFQRHGARGEAFFISNHANFAWFGRWGCRCRFFRLFRRFFRGVFVRATCSDDRRNQSGGNDDELRVHARYLA